MTPDPTPALERCPFCGGKEITYSYQGSSDWFFDCKKCPIMATFWVRLRKDEEWDEVREGEYRGEHARAVQYWNTRAPTYDPEKYVLVPREPTKEMTGAYILSQHRDYKMNYFYFLQGYKAMIGAAPKAGDVE